ncbi:hypothetical protein ACB094_04G147900 [Castanea mollissima]
MIPSFGTAGCDVPIETQFLLLEARDASSIHDENSKTTSENTFYILFLPVLDGLFRTTLQGTSANELDLCVESGDPDVQTFLVTEAIFINSGDNPFKLIRDSIKILEKHKGTDSHIENKKLPAHLDWFGWNTWDAFYTNVSAEAIEDGLRSFSEGGCPPKCLFIDDGWQNTAYEDDEQFTEDTNFVFRLVNLEENAKFKGEKPWGRLLPDSEALERYSPKYVYPVQSLGNLSHIICVTIDLVQTGGVEFVLPSKIFEFYNDVHGYLSSCGIDVVKVDVQNIVETVGAEALEKSVMRNFKSNNLICSMSLSNDYLYSSKKSAAARVSEDFMPNEPTFQTLHIAAVAFNSLVYGEIVVPDWDMFYSEHYTADFHGSARALGGCAVYVSDKRGSHNFNIIRKLVLPDGSILRARCAGRPTHDCLFNDPVIDGKSLLKIWNLNKLSGIIGVFNCQTAGKWPPVPGSQYLPPPGSAPSLECHVSPVEFLEKVADKSWNGTCAIYAFHSGSLSTMPKKGSFEVCLGLLKSEIFTISPITVLGHDIQFAPIGLLDMYNSKGAIEALECNDGEFAYMVKVQVRGCGRFGAYSNTKPRFCTVDSKEKHFMYNALASDGLLITNLQGECSFRDIEIVY